MATIPPQTTASKPEDDAKVLPHFDEIVAKFGVHGRAVQLCGNTNKKPTDVAIGWDDLTIPHHPQNYDCWVDVYQGPRGSGYVVWYQVKHDQDWFQKAINTGLEKWREQDWLVGPFVDVTKQGV